MIHSCGILLYRFKKDYEYFLIHPGGPYNKNAKWGIPKGRTEKTDDDYLSTAIREFSEEVGPIDFSKNLFIQIPHIKQNKHKILHCYLYNYDLGNDYVVKSNYVDVEYPSHSGKIISVPEVDDGKYFSYHECQDNMIPSQFPIIECADKFLNNII